MPDRDHWRNLALSDAEQLGLKVRLMLGYESRLGDGRADAIELAIQSNKPYFTWLDDDDRYPNTGALNALIEALDNSDAPFGFSAERLMSEDGTSILPCRPVSYDNRQHHAQPSHVHGLILIRTAAITPSILSDIRTARIPDHTLTLRLANDYGQPVITQLVVRHWRQHKSNTHRLRIKLGNAANKL